MLTGRGEGGASRSIGGGAAHVRLSTRKLGGADGNSERAGDGVWTPKPTSKIVPTCELRQDVGYRSCWNRGFKVPREKLLASAFNISKPPLFLKNPNPQCNRHAPEDGRRRDEKREEKEKN